MSTFNILYLSSEIAPFAKVGGLADVASSFPKYLKEKENDIRVLMPKYKIVRDRKYNLREVIRLRDIQVPLGSEIIPVSVKSGFIPDSKVQAYFLEYKPFFDRPDVYVNPKTGKGWEDNHLRFGLFARSAFEMLKVLYWQPDIIHVNDWPGALVPYLLKTVYKDDPFFENIKTVLTIHNLAYQGEFDAKAAPKIDPESGPFNENHPAWHHGRFNFLKAGILCADWVTTVSPTYAREIIENPEIGCGLGSVLESRGERFTGVLNGVDRQVWDPAYDKLIPANYSLEDLAPKNENREALCEEMGIAHDSETMIIGMVSRLAFQKGFDLFVAAIDRIMEENVAFVILGSGQADVQEALEAVAKKYPGRVIIRFAFDNTLAHLIEAGADAFLMPSRYEPCGLNQMYSLLYGTPPIVHTTGGLADTVDEWDPEKGIGNGFCFKNYTPDDLVMALKKALKTFTDKKAWEKLMRNGMASDFGWDKAVDRMFEIYSRVMAKEDSKPVEIVTQD